LVNIPGWRTKRKIIVIESDDWGSIRMPSTKVYKRALAKGIRVDKCPFNRLDTLANDDDLNALFETLTKIKDSKGRCLPITANTLAANPDFERIRKNNFLDYHYENFTVTLQKYYPNRDIFNLWREGIYKKIFHPQFHGREHLNVIRWMKNLKKDLPETKFAFDNDFFGISTTITTEERKSYQAAFDLETKEDLKFHKEIITDGLGLFKKIFNFRSKSFIAPNYVWSTGLETHLHNLGVDTIQGARSQWDPSSLNLVLKRHFMGNKNNKDQVYLIRNVIFEPALNRTIDSVANALKQVDIAFRWHKPAVISSHRLNYIGALNERNRKENLFLLNKFIEKAKEKYPDLIFMTSDELGDYILSNRKQIG